MATTEKEFVLSHVFKNVSSMKNYDYHRSPIEENFGVPWRISARRNTDHLGVYLGCLQENKDRESSIDFWMDQTITTVNGKTHSYNGDGTFKSTYTGDGLGWNQFISWGDLMTDYVIDDTLKVKIRVKIKKTVEACLRDFDESAKELSDVVLVVENQKFYVSKLFLANQSPFFKSTLLKLSESEEHTLNDVKAKDFQMFLELLHGENPINESTVTGIVSLAHLYGVKTAIQKCEQFLIKSSEKSLKEKLQLAQQYKLKDLKNNCLCKIDNVRQIREVLADSPEMDPSVVRALLQKSLDLHTSWKDLAIGKMRNCIRRVRGSS